MDSFRKLVFFAAILSLAAASAKEGETSPLRGFLGVAVSDLPPELRDHFDLPEGTGLMVEAVILDSPAERAGIQRNDILIRLNEQLLVNGPQLRTLVRNFQKDERIEVELIRQGARRKVEAVIEGRPDLPPPAPLPPPPQLFPPVQLFGRAFDPPIRRLLPTGTLGIVPREMDQRAAEQHGLNERGAVQVERVLPGSPAAQAGLTKGDILLEFNGRELRNSLQLQAWVLRLNPKDKVKLKLLRQDKILEIEVLVPDQVVPEFRPMPPLEELQELFPRFPQRPLPLPRLPEPHHLAGPGKRLSL